MSQISRDEITQSELIHLSLVKEFTQTFGSDQASALTHVSIQSLSESVGESGKVPPLTRRLMTMIVLECPFVEIHGTEYVEKLDQLLEKVYMELLQKFIRATQFDILACQSHMYSLMTHLYKQSLSENAIHSPSLIAPAGLEPWCQRVRQSRAFDIRGSILLQTHDHESVAIQRQEKFVAVAHSIQSLFFAIKSLQSQSHFWNVVKNCPTLDELPSVYSRTFDAILGALAHTLDVILDHQDRRQNLKRILEYIPISFIVFSLQWIDPTPLVEQVISLFVWKPPGIHSLLQKVGGLVCRDSETRQKLQDMRARLDSFALKTLDELLDDTKEISNSKARLEKIISCYEGSADEDVLNYIKTAIRNEEKSSFVDFLASTHVIELIKHLGHVYPLIINQIAKYGNIADFVSAFFLTLSKILDILQIYDESDNSSSDGESNDDEMQVDARWMQTIPQIKEAILPLFNLIYGMIYKASLDPEINVIHKTLDWLFALVNASLLAMPDMPEIQDAIGRDNMDRISEEMKYFHEYRNSETVDNHWPRMPVTETMGLDSIQKLILTKLGNVSKT